MNDPVYMAIIYLPSAIFVLMSLALMCADLKLAGYLNFLIFALSLFFRLYVAEGQTLSSEELGTPLKMMSFILAITAFVMTALSGFVITLYSLRRGPSEYQHDSTSGADRP